MCGIIGYLYLEQSGQAEQEIIARMATAIEHRGPDSYGYFVEDQIALGFRRLSIIDLAGGTQPIYNEDKSLVLVCNGEIYNYKELRRTLQQKGHHFSTQTDVEVLIHLYEEEQNDFLAHLNGQFAFALYDRNRQRLLLARDHFGIAPLFYTFVAGGKLCIFASEIKALLQHPQVQREVDLVGLDQILCFPGLVSPRTMFKNIKSLKSGHFLQIDGDGETLMKEYWDLNYPRIGEISNEKSDHYYIERMSELLQQAVTYRLQSDIPVGYYLSGGIDSSLIAALIHHVSPGQRQAFSIYFTEKEKSEEKYQRLMADYLQAKHSAQMFSSANIVDELARAVYHSEAPLKETYNAASLLLSRNAKRENISVILSGEGSDELFAGYVGYRFDQVRQASSRKYSLETVLEDEQRAKMWGDETFFYEKDYIAFREIKRALYSQTVNEELQEADCLDYEIINVERLQGRHVVHQRSYVDFKLRLADHLVADHGDRMTMANAVEGRYPFLDLQLVEFATTIPVALKMHHLTEKYIVKKVAERFLPREIIEREKFGFVAQDSPALLQSNVPWLHELLSYERIKSDGYFHPDTVERLKQRYTQPNFRLNIPFESDLLIVILTFNLFLDLFKMPRLGS